MVQLGFTADFKPQALQWDDATVHMKEPSSLLGKLDLTKREMRKVVMQTAEPASKQEDTAQMVKILNITYAKADLNQVADNATQMNTEERTLYLAFSETLRTCLMVL